MCYKQNRHLLSDLLQLDVILIPLFFPSTPKRSLLPEYRDSCKELPSKKWQDALKFHLKSNFMKEQLRY